MKWFGVVTLFPEMFAAIRENGVIGRAIQNGLVSLETWNPRDFTQDRHRTVDDRPYGGGPGMLMKVQPLQDAIRAAKKKGGEGVRTLYLSPQGNRLNQAKVVELAACDRLICVAGRYEGVDERLIESEVDEEISIGDFVLSGGEIAAMALIDTVSRTIPGVLGHDQSAQQDSFANGLLDCPHYTRPEVFDGICSDNQRAVKQKVPEVLMSGDHEKIRCWRLKQSLGRTWQRRPDLLDAIELNQEQQTLLQEFIKEMTR